MNRGLEWYKRDPIAFLDGIQGLGPEMIGAYAVILDLLYARAGMTPRDDRHLAGILGCSIRLATSLTDRLEAAGKITIEDGYIHNSRAETSAKSRRNLSETRAEAGRRGGEKSAEVRKNKALAEASAGSKIEPEEEREKDKRRTPLPPLGKTDEFEGFWTAYPHRGGIKKNRKGAERKFAALLKLGLAAEAIIDGAKAAHRQPEVRRGYARDPVTWLNQAGWQDEIGPQAVSAAGGEWTPMGFIREAV